MTDISNCGKSLQWFSHIITEDCLLNLSDIIWLDYFINTKKNNIYQTIYFYFMFHISIFSSHFNVIMSNFWASWFGCHMVYWGREFYY